MQGDVERAEACFAQILPEARAGGFTLGVATTLLGLGWVAMSKGDFDRAEELDREALDVIGSTDDPTVAIVTAGVILSDLGSIAFAQGRLELAKARFQEALGYQRQTGHRWGEALSLTGLGYVAARNKERQSASAYFRDALPLFGDHEDRRMVALTLAGVSGLAANGGIAGEAARLGGFAAALRQSGGLAAEPAFQSVVQQDQEMVRAALGESAFTEAWNEGQAMGLDEALATAALVLDAGTAAQDFAREADGHFGLTPREFDVLRLIADGRPDRQIADELSISPNTVMRHVQHILAKLDVESRTAAATQALRLGLV